MRDYLIFTDIRKDGPGKYVVPGQFAVDLTDEKYEEWAQDPDAYGYTFVKTTAAGDETERVTLLRKRPL